MHDTFDYAVALLGIMVPVALTLFLRRSNRFARLEKRVAKHGKILAVITGNPEIEGATD